MKSRKPKPKPKQFLCLDIPRRTALISGGVADVVLAEIEAEASSLIEFEALGEGEPSPAEILAELDRIERPANRLSAGLAAPLRHRTISYLRQHGAVGLDSKDVVVPVEGLFGPTFTFADTPSLWGHLQLLLRAIQAVRKQVSPWSAPTAADFPKALARIVKRILTKHDMVFGDRRGHATAILAAFLDQVGVSREEPRNYIRAVLGRKQSKQRKNLPKKA